MTQSKIRWLAVAALLLAACTTVPNEGQVMIDQGNYREGLARYEQAMRERPLDAQVRIRYYDARDQVVLRLLAQAAAEAVAGQFDQAMASYRLVLEVEPPNARAAAGLAAVEAARRQQLQAEEAKARLARGDILGAETMAKAVLTENPGQPLAREVERQVRERERNRAVTVPALKLRLQAPVNLEFRDAPLRQVMEALSRSAGINFILDREIRPDLKATIFVRNVRVEDAIDLILLNNQLEKKVLTDNTILVYPNTPAKLREHQELVMRSFQLGNADAKQMLNMLRTMLKTKELYVDERTNILVMRDTPDAVRAAERLIAAQDAADPEVVLELEILEAARAVVRDLGITWPTLFSGPDGTLAQITDLTRYTISTDSGFKLKLLRTDGDTKTLANPRVRVRNKEKARIHVGDRVPVVQATVVGTNATGTSAVTTEQVQYLDVGIKVDAEPTVYPDDTVAVKLAIEVSALGPPSTSKNGTTLYEIGTRNATTVLRLKDGETQALMGLISDSDIQAGTGLPFIGELPLLDRIFGTKKTERRGRELVLLITPHLVRGYRPSEMAQAEFWSGTEGSLRLRSPFVQTLADAQAQPTPTVASLSRSSAAPSALGAALPLALSWVLPSPLAAGQEGRVELRARSDGALTGASLQLRYDPEQLEVLGVEEGAFFKQGAGKTAFTSRVDVASGTVFATFGALDVPAKGAGSLLTLQVKPRGKTNKTRIEIGSAIGIDPASRRVPLAGGEAVELDFAP